MYCDEVRYMAPINHRVKNGDILKTFGHLTQKGSSVAHSPYNTSYIVWQVGP